MNYYCVYDNNNVHINFRIIHVCFHLENFSCYLSSGLVVRENRFDRTDDQVRGERERESVSPRSV